MTEVNRKIAFGSEHHRQVLRRLQERMRRATAAVNDRAEQWAKNEEQFLAYMPAKVNDQLRKGKREQGEPQFTTIEIPYSYAILLTAHTYLTSTFLARDPVLQVQGRHGEAENNVQAMESLLAYQTQVGGHLVPYYIWLLDALKYGTGVVGTYWDDETVQVRRRQKVPVTFLGVPIPGRFREEEFVERVRGYAGSRLYNVRPQDFFPDPSVSLSNFQAGEFCGRFVQFSWLDLVDGAAEGAYFNIDELRKNRRDGTRLRIDGSDQVDLPNNPQHSTMASEETETGTVDAHEIYVRLIPFDWGLGKERTSEKWVFTLAEDNVIIGCRPLGYYHDKFPFQVLESEIDGHSLFSRSMLETLKPMNDTLTWLLNTHFYNVRKSLNDQFVVDPSKIVMKDMMDPNPGRLIRLKPAAYGTDVRLAVQQMQVADVTRAHVNDSQLVMEMMQRVSGVNDNLMGMLNSGRKTATEVRSSTTFGINRLKTTTEYMSAMGFGPLTQQLVQVTQQMYDDARSYRIVGDTAQFATQLFRPILPEDIAGFYDFIPVDGTLPVDRFAQVQTWNQIMQQAGAMPQIMAQYDFSKIFAFVAQLAGLKNINQFRVQVVPDAMMQASAAAGNSVPAVADPMGVAANGGIPQPPQAPGMGQAG